VTTVDVNDATPGHFTIRIHAPNFQNLDPGDRITVFLNIDGNGANNDGGAEYAVDIEGATPSCGVYRWTGSQYTAVRFISCPYDFGPTFTFLRSDVGNPADFEFWIRSTWTNGTTLDLDRAPDSGWWSYDASPPETTISAGPAASTNSTNASFTFTSSEAGSSFQCSLDGAAFAACGSPAGYQNLTQGTHTFRVFASDPSGNADPTAASHTWRIVDLVAPRATARKGSCCDGRGRARLEYALADDSGRAQATVSIHAAGRRAPVRVCSAALDEALPSGYVLDCMVPTRARGWLRFCVTARDAAGNGSPNSCGRVTFGRLNADANGRYVAVGRTLRITAFSVTGLAGGKASIRCRGCRLRRGRPVGTRLRPGSRIEVRVVKPRVRGSFIRIANVRGALKKTKACLPPGLSGPVVSCRRSS
jgi:hypothetical protein